MRSQYLRSSFKNNITIEYVAEPLKAMPDDADGLGFSNTIEPAC
ncbi:hypothetical protein [Nostoc sp.]